jgi:malate dehydrogenase (oxaloacetate-decarboxylating)(NADP+)
MLSELDQRARDYHALSPSGKLRVSPTKPVMTQDDLSLAYSPGVAAPCLEIARDSNLAATYTGRSNLVGVISNGTAVLGLGNIGALASKPVMEGKAALFQRFSGINVFDIEIAEEDPDRFCTIVAGLEATFGGINLEDIKAPQCFEIERRLRSEMSIPVFHDDQHGTAVVAGAAIRSGLKIANKNLADCKLVCSGAGAAAMACADLLIEMGLLRDNIIMLDSRGVIFPGRNQPMDPYKDRYATTSAVRSMDEAISGADIFLGLSGPGSINAEQCKRMANDPLVLALANPNPEIMPEAVHAVRDDAMICTGRSDYPNQVNNVLCFPFMFRGALDVGASAINEAMKIACVDALSTLTESEAPDEVKAIYPGQEFSLGAGYLLPTPFDPRLIVDIASAVAQAAMDSGVASRPIEDMDGYREHLSKLL